MSAQALCHNVVRAGVCTPHDGFSTLRTFIVRSVSVASTLRLPIPPPHPLARPAIAKVFAGTAEVVLSLPTNRRQFRLRSVV